MIINNAPENAVELSGVTATSEFRIRNSAKAFGILSSGLYANKIRAIIREIGCNAVDSHVAAGTPELPFELHLPTALSPYFWVRDFGIGLDHDEVINIYTTYFESTKTNSNAFIGALGLGSKSPFSYTDNFTVTAIKNKVKRVYSAFINEQGVPSVALMGEGPTDESNGVEVKFSVNDRDDFARFKIEAEATLQYFKTQPTIIGNKANIPVIKYIAKDIIPGVHQRDGGDYYDGSENRAIMGNIAYPIDIPQKKQRDEWNRTEGPYDRLSRAGLDIHFDIGDVEFQASREGLSYTQSTIDAIHAKYQLILDALETRLAEEIDKIENLWDKAEVLLKRASTTLWVLAANQYQKRHPNPLFETNTRYNNHLGYRSFNIVLADVATKYNLDIEIFNVNYYSRGIRNLRPLHVVKPDHRGQHQISLYHRALHFVKHPDLKLKGYVGNLRYHFGRSEANTQVIVMTAKDATKPALMDDFLKDVFYNPPNVIVDKDLEVAPKIERAKTERKVSILAIGKHRSKGELAWAEVNAQPKDMDASKTYYYVPMHGFTVNLPGHTPGSNDGKVDIKYTFESFTRCYPGTEMDQIYGVRKGDLDVVQALPNWKPAFDFIKDKFTNLSEKDFYRVAINEIDRRQGSIYTNASIGSKVTDAGSAFTAFQKDLSAINSSSMAELKDLCKAFAPTVNIEDLEKKAAKKAKEISNRYPMLGLMDHVGWNAYKTIADYINLIDSTLKEKA